jgi:hypothetical protein
MARVEVPVVSTSPQLAKSLKSSKSVEVIRGHSTMDDIGFPAFLEHELAPFTNRMASRRALKPAQDMMV